MTKLFILYDAQCPFCLRCRQWLGAQKTFSQMEFVPFQSPELIARFEGIESFRKTPGLLVVGDDGGVYQGSNAIVILLYALENYRECAFRMAEADLMPLAAQYFDLLTSGRNGISEWLGRLDNEELVEVLRQQPPPICCGTPIPQPHYKQHVS